MLSLLVPFGCALVLAYVLTPLVIRAAHRAGILDVPNDQRRAHSIPIPRLGGIAVVVAIGLTWLGISIELGAPWNPLGPQYGPAVQGILLGSGMIFVAGLFDDVRGLSPRLKLTFQTFAATVVVGYGLTPSAVAIVPNSAVWHVGEAVMTGVLILWIVGITNAFNLIDGLDGLASGFAVVAAGVTLCSALTIKAGISPTLPSIIAGALVGFLRYNWNPARIFLGDAGSMTLGFIFATLTVIASTDATGITYPIISILALAFPIIDTLIAIARRWVRGLPLSMADGRHIHHQLRGIGLSVTQTTTVLISFFTFIAAIGLTIIFSPPRHTMYMLALSTILLIVIIVYGIRLLRYYEFAEVGATVQSTLRQTRHVVRISIATNEAADRILRAATLSEIREILGDLAVQVGLVDIELLEPGDKKRATPPHQQIAHVTALPMRLDYCLALGQSNSHHIIIRLWDRPDAKKRTYTMERVATGIGKATEAWYATNVDWEGAIIHSAANTSSH